MPGYLLTLLAPDYAHVSRKRREDLDVCWRDWLPSQQLHPLPLVTLREVLLWPRLLLWEQLPPISGKGNGISGALGLLPQTG